MMDPSIERRYAVYRPWPDHWHLLSCPADQVPVSTPKIEFTGTQQQCERYMRDIARLRTIQGAR